MANDLTDVLRAQLRDVAREAATNIGSASAETHQKSSSLSGLKGVVLGAGIAMIAKAGIDAARRGNPALVMDLSERISAKLSEVQGNGDGATDDEEPTAEADEAEEEPEAELEEEEPEGEFEEEEPEGEFEEEEPEARGGARGRG